MKKYLQSVFAVSLIAVVALSASDADAQSKAARSQVAPTQTSAHTAARPADLLRAQDGQTLLERTRSRYGSTSAQGHRIISNVPLQVASSLTLGVATPGAHQSTRLDFHLTRSDNGTVSWLQGDLGRAEASGKAWSTAVYERAAYSAFDSYAGLLKLADPSQELAPVTTDLDDLGFTHARFEQEYRGVPVWNADLIAHFDDTGKLYAINGAYQPTPEALDLNPALGKTRALAAAVDDLINRARWAPLDADVAKWLGLEDAEPRLVVYPTPDDGPVLAWDVSVHSSLVERYRYVINAKTGAILNRLSEHCTLHAVLGDQPPVPTASISIPSSESSAFAPSAEFKDAQGLDLNGQTTNFRVHLANDGQHYMFWDLDNLGTFSLPNLPENGGAVTLTANNQDLAQETELGFVTSGDNTWADPATVSAHANMKATYDYFKNTFGRKAINDKDQSIVSIAHVTQDKQPMDNAYWNGRVMAYGDGNQTFKPLAGARDVSAHEMTHGVINGSADLIYQGQSGALNESFADVFGAMNDRDDLLMGEDVMKDGHIALRDLLNPTNPQVRSGDAAVNGDYTQPGNMSEYRNLPLTPEADNGGVHINSGIPNRAAALTIQSIGHDKTQEIYYRALTQYLTRNSEFGDARKALIQAATDLYGAGGAEANAVAQAYDAVGVSEGSDTVDPSQNDVPTVNGNLSLIAFVVSDGTNAGIPDGSIAFFDPYSQDPNGFIGVFSDPNAVARVGSQLSATTDGSSLWFINTDGVLSVLDLLNVDSSTPDGIAAAPVLVAQDIYVDQPGDLYNASVGAAGVADDGTLIEFIALTSVYDNDPTIYFTDLNDIIPVEIRPVTSVQGVDNQLVRYPDVISWSPNPYAPKVAFDALNTVPTLGGSSDYWSIYELDFAIGQTYGLIPAQPTDISVGNITYSSLNPDIVAFNVITLDNFGNPLYDIYLADFESGQLSPLELPSVTDNQGNAILTDAERPTFAPDDSYLAFSSASLSSVIFMDANTGDLSQSQFVVPPFNPFWFVLNGDVTDIVATGTESEPEIPTTTGLLSNYPNPFSGSSTIQYDLAQAGQISIEVFDALGRLVAHVADGWQQAGRHESLFRAASLTPGTYFARLTVDGQAFVHKLLVTR